MEMGKAPGVYDIGICQPLQRKYEKDTPSKKRINAPASCDVHRSYRISLLIYDTRPQDLGNSPSTLARDVPAVIPDDFFAAELFPVLNGGRNAAEWGVIQGSYKVKAGAFQMGQASRLGIDRDGTLGMKSVRMLVASRDVEDRTSIYLVEHEP